MKTCLLFASSRNRSLIWKQTKGKTGVLSLLFAISSFLHNPVYYLNNSHKQSLWLCFDTELLPVLQAPIPSPWLFQPLLYLKVKRNVPDQAITLVKTSGLGFYCSLLMFGLFLWPDRAHHRASLRPHLLNIGYPGSKGCACSALLILPRLTFLRHEFPRLFCCSITSSARSLWSPSSLLLMPFFSTVHHSFHSTSKQTRVDCPAQRPPWGPSALWKTVCSHPGFVRLTVSNHSNGLLSPFKLLNGPVRIWDKDFKTPKLYLSNLLFPFC